MKTPMEFDGTKISLAESESTALGLSEVYGLLTASEVADLTFHALRSVALERAMLRGEVRDFVQTMGQLDVEGTPYLQVSHRLGQTSLGQRQAALLQQERLLSDMYGTVAAMSHRDE